jgi:DnaK suppressor protein
MQPNENSEFRECLEQKAREIGGALRDRDSIAVERASDTVDQLNLAIEREKGALALEAGTNLLRQVKAALRRIEEESYGLCLDCGEEISAKRLRALPWAVRCVHCQEQEDRAKSQKRFSEAA